jgi:uncharacterized RDD family membrane protein YckC
MAYPAQADPTKVIGRRILATLIDAALVVIPAVVLVTASFEYHPIERLEAAGITAEEFCDDRIDEGDLCADLSEINDRVYFADDDVPAGPTLLFWGSSLLMLVVLQGLTGWTIGKLLTGIRTVRADGRPPGLLKALVRWLLWAVDGFPYVLPLVGFITALTTVGHRRVGDMAASTYVVRRSAAGSPITVPGLTPPEPPAGQVAGVPWATTTPPGTFQGGPSPSAAPAAAPGPQWDQARGTYIQWDPGQGAWLQWDEPTRAWTRIPGQ